jgi:phosphatidylglycerophosphatase A
LSALARLLATGFYTGYAPVASGTFGSLPGVAIAFLIGTYLSPGFYTAALVAIIVACIWSADRHAAELQIKDPSVIVSDEVAGMLVAIAYLPITPLTMLTAFLLFRFFDILKPPPIRQAEDLPGGFGICADDLLAGLASNLILRGAIAVGLIPVG